jgi:ATP/maltotriose-dependent transcriptional regulator MalT
LRLGTSDFGIRSSRIRKIDGSKCLVIRTYGYIAAATGDIEGVFTHARYVLERIPTDQYFKRGTAEMMLGFAHWINGDLIEAESVILNSFHNIKKAAIPLMENSYYMVLGELYIQQGALAKAKAMLEQTIARLIKENLVTILLPSLYLGLGKIAFLQGNNKQAYTLLNESKTHAQRSVLMDWKFKYYLLLARIYCSEGLYDLARDCIKESKTYYYIYPIPLDVGIEEVEKQIETEAAYHHPRQIPGAKDETEATFKKEHRNQSLTEPLTARELEVLSLIVSGLTNQEICDRLFLALSTVKGYNQNIFGKLEVSRRTQAIAKARELGLV